MATSVYGGNYGSSFQLELLVTQTSQNINDNTSTVSIVGRMNRIATNGGTIYNGNPTTWSATVNGVNYSGTLTYNSSSLGTISTFLNTTQTIAHNEDGTKSISYSASHNANNSPYLTTASLSTSMSLTTIARATQPTVSSNNVNIGSSVTINMPRASSSFTHSLWYTINGGSWIGIGSGYGTSLAWTIPNTVLNSIPDSVTADISVICRTYNGSTQIGKDKAISGSIKATAPSNIVPTFSSISHSENVSNVSSVVGRYVQTLSRLNVAIVGASGTYGSRIVSYNITVDGQVLNAVSGVTKTLSSSGTLAIKATVTDSRGRIATSSTNITVLPYVLPKINSLTMYRSNSSGVRDEVGTSVTVKLDCGVQSLVNGTEKNSLTYKILSRQSGTSSYTTKKTETASGISLNNQSIVSTYAIDYSFDFQIQLTDKFNTTISIGTISTGVVSMQWLKDKISVGKLWQQGTIDAMNQIYQNDGQKVIDETMLLNKIYPIGSIYMSVNNVSPQSFLGGVWQVWSSGRVLVGVDTTQQEFNSASKTGGSKEIQSHSHTGVATSNGNHTHYTAGMVNASGQGTATPVPQGSYYGFGYGVSLQTTSNGAHTHTLSINSFGEGNSGNLQPYVTCFMWRRVS